MKQTDESIVQVPVSSLRSFPNHPFRITDDESMQQLVDSIRLLGVNAKIRMNKNYHIRMLR